MKLIHGTTAVFSLLLFFSFPGTGHADKTSQPQTAEQVLDEMQKVQRSMFEFFNDSVKRFNNAAPGSFSVPSGELYFQPRADVEDRGNDLVATFDLPGMKKEQIKIDVTDSILTVSGERQIEKEDRKLLTKEISYGSFSRTINLPEKVQAEKAAAKYENGVLEITLPKAGPSQKATKVTIK